MALSDWDKKHLNSGQQRAVLSYTEAWERATRAGDTTAARKAHEGAEAIRAPGYSGGAAGASFTAAASGGYNNGSLSKSDVKTLQAALGVEQDGYFGPKTQTAAFQRWGAENADSALRAYRSASTPARTSYGFDEDEGTYHWNGQTFDSKKKLTEAMNAAKLTAAEKNVLDRKTQGSGVSLQGGRFGSTTPEPEEPRYLAAPDLAEERQTNRAVLGGRNPAAVSQREARRNERIDRYNAAKDAYESVDRDLTQMYGLTDAQREAKWQENEKIRQEYEDARASLERYGIDPDNPNGEPTLVERLRNILSGSAKLYGAQGVGVVEAAANVEQAYRNAVPQSYERDVERAWTRPTPESVNEQARYYQQLGSGLKASGSADVERAQEGLGRLGRLGVNAGVAMTQMGADVGLGLLTGGGSMLPMLVRTFGGGVQEAREKGYDVKQQLALGMANAATEYVTEKLFGGNPAYDTDVGLVNKAINRLTRNKTWNGKLMNALSSLPADMLSEGLEEVLADIVEPAAEWAITGNRPEYELDQIIEDGLVGMLMSIAGHGGQYVAETVRGEPLYLPTAEEIAGESPASVRRGGAVMTNEARTGDSIPEMNRGAETQKTAPDGTGTGTSKGGIKGFFKEISDYVDRAISRSRFVENPIISDERFDDLPIGQISENEVNKLKREYGIDLSGYNHVLSDNDIRHIYNRHGPHTNEQLPVTAEDIKNIPAIIRDADDIYFLPRDDGKKGLMYRYEAGNTTYYLEEILDSERVLRNKQMIKVPSGEVPNIKGLQEAIDKKSIKSAPDDAAMAVPQMYAQDVRIDADNSIPASQPIVNEKSAPEEPLALEAPDLDAAREDAARQAAQTAEEPALPLEAPDLGLGDDGLGGADAGSVNTDYDRLQAESDTFHPSGPAPVRHTDVPTKNFEGRNIPKSTSTIYGAQGTPDAAVMQLEQMIADGTLAFDTITDKDAVASARAAVESKSFEGALEQYRNTVNSNAVSKNNTALGQQLLLQAMREGNTAATAELLTLYTRNSTNMAQAMQAQSIFRKLSPEGQLVGIQRAVDSFNEKHGTNIQISEEDVSDYIGAADNAAREAVRERIYKNVAQQAPSTFRAKFDAIRYLAMLGNPRTHIRNILGNVLFQAPVIAKNRVGALGEIIAGAASGGKVERTKSLTGANPFGSLAKEARADFEKVKSFLGQVSKYSEGQAAAADIEQNVPAFSNGNIIGKGLNFLSEGNSALLEAEDTAAKKFIYTQSLAGYLKANGVKTMQGLDGTEEGRALLDRARNYAAQEAMRNTFNDKNKLSDAVASLGKLSRSGNPFVKGLGYVVEGALPFKRTPANILARAGEYSPVGAANGIVELVKGAKAGDSAAVTQGIDRLASGLTGSALMLLGWTLAGSGLIRGGEDEDDKQAAFNKLRGHQNYSLELSDGTSVTLDWLAPEAIPFFMGAELYNTSLENGMSFDDVRRVFKNATSPMLEMSMLQGLNNLFDSAAYAQRSGDNVMMSIATSALTNYLTQAFPTIFGQAERTFGEDERMTTYTDKNQWMPSDWQYTLGKVTQKLPGVDYNQIPYVDAWGRTESTGGLGERAVSNFANPAFLSQISDDGVEDELQRLYDTTGEAGVLPQRAARYFNVGGERKDLTGEEYVAYAAEKGQRSRQLVEDFLGSAAYAQMDDDARAKAISELYTYANAKAKEAVFGVELPSTAAKLEAAIQSGISPAQYYAYNAKLDALTPLDGAKGVSDMQRYRAIAGEELLDSDEKRAAIGEIMGTDMTTEKGNPSQFAKMTEMLDGGASLDQYLDVKEADKLDTYAKFSQAGLDSEDSYELTMAMAGLAPEEGKDAVSNLQKYRAVTQTDLSDESQLLALSTMMQDGEIGKVWTGYNCGIPPRVYMDFKAELPGYDADGNGNYTQQEIKAAIDGIAESLDYISLGGRGPLTTEEKATLWQLANKSWKPGKNPYSVSVGTRIYDVMHNGEGVPEDLAGALALAAP